MALLPGAKLLKRVRRRWPATMLAANRTDSVRGRIMFLTNSIMTIKGIKGTGVPEGTKCANILFGDLVQPKIICPNHKGRASLTVKVKCLEAVKTKGIIPNELFVTTKKNTTIGIRVSPGALLFPKTAINSLYKKSFVF